MNCPQCGTPIEPAATYCTNCGCHLTNIPPQQSISGVPKEYKPVSPWGYVGLGVLFAIPVLGVILLIVLSFTKGNLNVRNYARSFWCALLLAIVLCVIAAIVAAATGSSDELMRILQQFSNSLSGI